MAQEPLVRDGAVLERQALMKSAKSALAILNDMSGMRIQFDRTQARAAKWQLVAALDQIPDRFKSPYMDPHSRARRMIWRNWEDFSRNAATARNTAKDIRVRNLSTLRVSLPPMLGACLACHQLYRKEKY